jgi:centromere protein C
MQADLSPAGNTYSIRNVGSGTARIFFAQAREMNVEDEE